jgi:tetratricopeptide (TPR) repeat protein
MSPPGGPESESASLSGPDALVTWPPEITNEGPAPQTIGNYRIIEQVGVGGMGIVYKAEQLRPMNRVVALKLIKLGMDTREVIARFASERQALAMLEHPGIARVYDAGATDTGRPYFVMEFVPGHSITQYCDAHRLLIPERLRLFEQVCQAVQYAHYKGVLHRDIKPSNVLVCDIEGADRQAAAPKVIDFGVAKATQATPGVTVATGIGQIIGTPQYMSPEQAAGGDVDTRTDVYSLGILLYELLAGVLPRIEAGSESQKPSTRLTTLGTQTGSVAQSRGTDPSTLRRSLRGDLDLIVMKAIDPDRANRYGTAAALAEDVRRHLANEPVTVRPPTLSYQARKFARRNKVLVGASVVVLCVLILGIIGTGVGMVRARRALVREGLARQRAEDINQFLSSMLTAADPATAPGRQVTVREVLDQAAAQLPLRFASQPLVEGPLQHDLAKVYYSLGLRPEAIDHAQRAVTLLKPAAGDDARETLAARSSLSAMLSEHGQFADAEAIQRDVVTRAQRQFGADDPLVLEISLNQASLLSSRHEPKEAEKIARDVFHRSRKILGDEHAVTLYAMQELSQALYMQWRYDECAQVYELLLQHLTKKHGSDHPLTIRTAGSLAALWVSVNRLSDAEPLLKDTLERSGRVLGTNHPTTLMTESNYAGVLRKLGRRNESEAMLRDVLERQQHVLGSDDPANIEMVIHLGSLLNAANRFEEAAPLQRAALEQSQRMLGKEHVDSLQLATNYAVTLRALGKLTDAAELQRQTLEIERSTLGEDHPVTLSTANGLAVTLRAQGQNDEAILLQRDILQRRERTLGSMNPDTLTSANNLGVALLAAGKFDEAQIVLAQTLQRRRAASGIEPTEIQITSAMLSEALMRLKKYQQAEPLLAELYPLAQAKQLPRAASAARCVLNYGICLAQLHKYDLAEPILLAAAKEKPDDAVSLKRFREVTSALAELYDATGRSDQALAWREKSANASTAPAPTTSAVR